MESLEEVRTDGAETVFDALREQSYWDAGDPTNNCKSSMFYCLTHSEMDCFDRFKDALKTTTSEEKLLKYTETFVGRPIIKDVLADFEDDDVKRKKEFGIGNVYAKIDKIDIDYSQSIAKYTNKIHFIQHVLMGMQARNEFVSMAYGRMYEKDEPHEKRIDFFKKLNYKGGGSTYERLCYMMQHYNQWLSARMTLFLTILDGREAEVYLNYAPLGRRSLDNSGPEWISFHRLLADVGETWSGKGGQNQNRSVFRVSRLESVLENEPYLSFNPPYDEGGVFPEMLFPLTIKFNVKVNVGAIPEQSKFAMTSLFKENFVKVFLSVFKAQKAFAHTTVSVSSSSTRGISKLIFTISFGVEDVPLLGKDSEEKKDHLRKKINEALNQMANIDRENFSEFYSVKTAEAAEEFWTKSYWFGGLASVLQPLVDVQPQVDDPDILDKTMNLSHKLPYLTGKASKEILNIEKAASNMLKNAQDFIGKTIYPGYSNNQGAVIRVGNQRYVAMVHDSRETSGWLYKGVSGQDPDVNVPGTLKWLQAALNSKAGVSDVKGGGGASRRSGSATGKAGSESVKRAKLQHRNLDVDQEQSRNVCGTFEDKKDVLQGMKADSGKSRLDNVDNRIRFLFKDAEDNPMHRVPVPTYRNEEYTRSFASSFAFAALLMGEFEIHAAIMKKPELLKHVEVTLLNNPQYWIEKYKEVCDLLNTKDIGVQICVNCGMGRDRKERKQILYPLRANEGAKVFSFFLSHSSFIYEPLIPESKLVKYDLLLRDLTRKESAIRLQQYIEKGFSEFAIRLAIIGENKEKRIRLHSALKYPYDSSIIVDYDTFFADNGNGETPSDPFLYDFDLH